jgi:PAS domain S-box-containing protein
MAVYEQLPIFLTSTDRDGIIKFTNQDFISITREEARGKNIIDCVLPEFRSTLAEYINVIKSTGQETSYEVRIATQWFNVRILPQMAHDTITGNIIIMENILGKKEVELEAQNTLTRYQTLFESAPIGIVVDRENNILLTNPQFHKIFGYLPEENLEGMYLSEIQPPEIREFQKERRRKRESGLPEPSSYETIGLRKDGTRINMHVDVIQIDLPDGSANLTFIQDITERVKAQKGFVSSLVRYETLFNSAPIGIVLIRDDTILMTNDYLVQMYGYYSTSELIGKKIFMLQTEDVRELLFERGQRRIQGLPEPTHYESVGLKRDGNSFPIQVDVTRIELPTGAALIGFIRDITQRKQAEADRLRASKIESIALLAGGIAHDFNNILVGILGNINLLQLTKELDQDITNSLRDIEKATLRASDLTKQLLTFSKGGAPLKKPESIRRIVEDSITFVMHGSKSKAITHFHDPLPAVDVDSGQISQVLHNILLNSIQAMPDGGIISIEVGAEYHAGGEVHLPIGEYVKLIIQDDGIGIPREYHDQIFEPYFTTKSGGSGLGLATCYSVITQHQGYIKMASTEGQGTAFFIYLPTSKDPISLLEEELHFDQLFTGKVLLMDDDLIVQETVAQMLIHLGISVDRVSDGTSAIKKYKQGLENKEGYSLVILDLTIPGGLGGKETILKIREIDPNVIAIASSGYSNDPVMSQYKDYGFDGILVKPYTMQALRETLARYLENENF